MVLLYGLQGKIDTEGQQAGYAGVMPNQYSLNVQIDTFSIK
jgi:hypothetical protein